MKATNEENRGQKNALDKLDLKLMLKKAQEGGAYMDGYNNGYLAGKRAAVREIMKQMGQK